MWVYGQGEGTHNDTASPMEGTLKAKSSTLFLFKLPWWAQTVKRLPIMRETQVQSLGQEDPLEKEMATHSSTLAWKIPWTEEPVGYSPWGPKELDTTE